MNVSTLIQVRDELRSLTSGLFGCFRKSFLSPSARLYYLASLWDVFELQMACEAEAASLSEHQSPGTEDSGVAATAITNMVKAIGEVGASLLLNKLAPASPAGIADDDNLSSVIDR